MRNTGGMKSDQKMTRQGVRDLGGNNGKRKPKVEQPPEQAPMRVDDEYAFWSELYLEEYFGAKKGRRR